MNFTGSEPAHSRPFLRNHFCVRAIVAGLLNTLRTVTYALLAVLRPVIVVCLAGATLVCLGLCLFFATLAPETHFPFLGVFSMAVLCAMLIVAYYAVMELLLPT